jgi:membrane protein YdbS with pleckstrin-like domain
LFVVGLAYAVIVLMAVPPQLLSADVDRSLWAYVAFSAVFAIAIVFLIWGYEKRSRGKGAAD